MKRSGPTFRSWINFQILSSHLGKIRRPWRISLYIFQDSELNGKNPAKKNEVMQIEDLHLKIVAEGDLIRITSSGQFSLEASKLAFLKALEAVKRYRISKVLFDGSEITGEPTTMERF